MLITQNLSGKHKRKRKKKCKVQNCDKNLRDSANEEFQEKKTTNYTGTDFIKFGSLNLIIY